MGPSQLAVAPTVALATALLLALVARWIFGPDRRRGRTPRPGRPDYGLLVPVVRCDGAGDAAQLCALLAAHGIRATGAPAGRGYDGSGRPWPPGAWYVLVFPADAERARGLAEAERQS